jgi:hypothetical protein
MLVKVPIDLCLLCLGGVCTDYCLILKDMLISYLAQAESDIISSRTRFDHVKDSVLRSRIRDNL